MEDLPEEPPELTHEDRAGLAIRRVVDLASEALQQPNSTAMD